MYVAHYSGTRGFGAFGGTWEDWCDGAYSDGKLNDQQLKQCKSWSICGPPWTAAGSGCRGIPNLGQNQSGWAKAAGAITGWAATAASVFTLGAATPGGAFNLKSIGGQAGSTVTSLVGTAKSVVDVAKDVVAEVIPPPPPIEAPQQAIQKAGIGLGGGLAVMLIGGAVLSAAAVLSNKKKSKGRRRRK